ncbi:hypothetical protein SK128_002420, partial [Halocaridina rubra]
MKTDALVSKVNPTRCVDGVLLNPIPLKVSALSPCPLGWLLHLPKPDGSTFLVTPVREANSLLDEMM